MDRLSADSLLRLPVCLHGIELGRTVDISVDPGGRVLGLEVICRDDCRRFLPLAAAELAADKILVHSPLTLMETSDSAFYRKRASTLNALRGSPVFSRGHALGSLRDVVLDGSGAIVAVVVEDDEGERRVPFDGAVAIGVPRSRAPAA